MYQGLAIIFLSLSLSHFLFPQFVSDVQLQTLKSLKELVNKEGNYHRFHAEFKGLHSVPTIPLLGNSRSTTFAISHKYYF